MTAPGPRFVDLQRDVTVADLRRATAAGMRSVEHTKRYTTAGTANDQGKTSGVLASGVVAGLLGVEVSALGTTTYRPPYAPVSFAALAGRDRGALHDPVRVTALHDLHVAGGAVFEDVGQWKRPRYYPRPGEGMTAAVLRECRAAREDVAFMDASTLGKIDVQGPDAAEFLDRLYTNLMSTLRPGMIRYGVMCRQDGMVFDDGTVIRLAEDRFLATTTTGNAAAVLDWMEEWLQTEWPELRVHCTSVTEQWATVALVGPRSREVLGALAPGLAVSRAEFPFMAWRDATVAGLPARVCRISFSGELAYEINVLPWRATTLWEAVRAAGATPYGTETMHVLRAEKGYPIVGQDTDGTVTPQDLGMGWVVSKKKRDFIGKRSHARADTARPDRKHLVGLLPEDPGLLLPEGTHLVADPVPPRPPPRRSVTSAPATAAPPSAAPSRSPWSRGAGSGWGSGSTRPSTDVWCPSPSPPRPLRPRGGPPRWLTPTPASVRCRPRRPPRRRDPGLGRRTAPGRTALPRADRPAPGPRGPGRRGRRARPGRAASPGAVHRRPHR